jgi:hypothetical protein
MRTLKPPAELVVPLRPDDSLVFTGGADGVRVRSANTDVAAFSESR